MLTHCGTQLMLLERWPVKIIDVHRKYGNISEVSVARCGHACHVKKIDSLAMESSQEKV
jgi:hypothetical protein